MTNKHPLNVQDYRKEDIYFNSKKIPEFINLDLVYDTFTLPADKFKTTRFVRTDGKPSHKIKLRLQDMDIEAELTSDEVLNFSRVISDAVTAIIEADTHHEW